MSLLLLALIGLFLAFLLSITSVIRQWCIFFYKAEQLPGYGPMRSIFLSYKLLQLTPQGRTKFMLERDREDPVGIWKMWLGRDLFVRLRTPEYVEAVLSSSVNIDKAVFYKYFHPWLGQGLLTSSGQKWFHDRKALTPAFHFNILDQFVGVMHEKTDILIKRLHSDIQKNPGEALNIFPRSILYTLDIICETAMGININAQENESHEYVKSLNAFVQLVLDRILLPWGGSDFLYFSTGAGKKLLRAVEVMHRFTNAVIQKRKLARQRVNNDVTPVNKNDDDHDQGEGGVYFSIKNRKAFLDLMLDANENSDNPMTDRDIREQVDTFMFEGHDTTAAAISWCCFNLAYNPHIQEKVHEELERVFGDSTERPTIQQLSELKYLDRVIKESLRLHPSVPEVIRHLKTDVQMGEFLVPKGAQVSITPALTHRDPNTWPDPDKFDPDRFLPENIKSRNVYAYIPFSAGPRNCIGQKFAQMEEKISITAILRNFRLKPAGPAEELPYYFGLILRPTKGVFLHFIPKKGNVISA